jgi:hypothetical protein
MNVKTHIKKIRTGVDSFYSRPDAWLELSISSSASKSLSWVFPRVLQKAWIEYFLECFKKLELIISSSASKSLSRILPRMPGYKYPNIDSGPTPIRSASRAPDKKTILSKNSTKRDEENLSLWSTTSTDHSLGANPIGNADRAPDEELIREDKKQWRKLSNPLSVVNTKNIYSIFTPIGRADCASTK